MNVKEFYDYITSQLTPEAALMKLLEGHVLEYEKLKFDDQEKAVHPIHIIAMAAMDLGWQIAIEHREDVEDVRGICVGTNDYMESVIKAK